MGTQRTLHEVVDAHREQIMGVEGVVGVGVGLSPRNRGLKCILVYVTTSRWPPDLPTELDGHPVEIVTRSKGFRAL